MVDYSKWKNIEVSDDEDETHPNIDTPSLFRWRHQARVDRMEEIKREQQELETKKKIFQEKLQTTKQQLSEAENQGKNKKELEEALSALTVEEQELKKKEEEFKNKEKVMPWNVDTISKPGFTKTIVNTPKGPPQEENLTEEEKAKRLEKFIEENKSKLKTFGMFKKYKDSQEYLQKNPQLVCEDTANYLVIWCIDLQMEGKSDLMEHVAHQTICMQYILELSRQLNIDPRACVPSFFSRIQMAEKQYKDSFDEELSMFKDRIRKRAEEKLRIAQAEIEEEEKQARLGPGGLDPVEVFESLPDELKRCFESQDIQLLQDTIKNMDQADAAFYMKQCVDSGLWVPDANKDKKNEEDDSCKTQEENIYSEVDS
ncbi:hsp90 co-chaperone Cdc37 [Daktulosphaira vitifoliae]|uniref:hsp90 co-chaperone Cdc37 n=1 Tax=Daktulosphaira vitifoliae TaxID=58002 RepID=UPI0021A9AC75|nr:hsp90 co-chaperone Cdc37 [Daktulosphaira vitifoliae]